jgi:hypothetical protein
MTIELERNPFEITKATDFSDREILDFWVDLVGSDDVHQILRPTEVMPLLLLGSKGSGKTHLLRYCSYPVRKLKWHSDPVSGINHDGYLGIYVRADGLNSSRFSGKGIPDDQWAALFQYYFECWVTRLLVDVVEELHTTGSRESEASSVQKFGQLFDAPVEFQAPTCVAVRDFLDAEIRRIDYAVNNAAFVRTIEHAIGFSPGRLIMDSPEIFADALSINKAARFIFLFDELENFSMDQQRFINSLIRYRRGRVSIRVGARLYGIRTYETGGAREKNKRGSEFDVIYLDHLLREGRNYPTCARVLCAKRLVQGGYFPATTSMTALADRLDGYFVTPHKDSLAEEETRRLVSKYADRERPYFSKLEQQLEKNGGGLLQGSSPRDIIALLRSPDFPLLEKLNILQLYQAWSRNEPLITAARRAQEQMNAYLNAPRRKSPYAEDLSHYKSDLIAQLYRECRTPPVYSGLELFIRMSSGVPRNLLGLLKHVFRRATFNGEIPFGPKPISIDSQQEGVRDAAAWFLDDAQPDSFGSEVRTAIDLLTQLLREVRFSDKPAECAVSSFTSNIQEWSDASRRVLEHAENWSFLLKIGEGAKEKNSKAMYPKYQLNPILAPQKDLSTARRGTLSLDRIMAEAIFDPSSREAFADLLKNRIAGMNVPFKSTRDDQTFQLGLDSPP